MQDGVLERILYKSIEDITISKPWKRKSGFLTEIISPQFLTIELHFLPQGCDRHLKITIWPQFLRVEAEFVREGCRGHFKPAILRQFWTIKPHFVQKGGRGDFKSAILFQILTIEPLFRAKGLHVTQEKHNFTAAFDDWTSFRGTPPRLEDFA